LIGEGKDPFRLISTSKASCGAKERGVDAFSRHGFLSGKSGPSTRLRALDTFSGASAELLDLLGDKTAAAAVGQKPACPWAGNARAGHVRRTTQRASRKNRYRLMVKCGVRRRGRGMRGR